MCVCGGVCVCVSRGFAQTMNDFTMDEITDMEAFIAFDHRLADDFEENLKKEEKEMNEEMEKDEALKQYMSQNPESEEELQKEMDQDIVREHEQRNGKIDLPPESENFFKRHWITVTGVPGCGKAKFCNRFREEAQDKTVLIWKSSCDLVLDVLKYADDPPQTWKTQNLLELVKNNVAFDPFLKKNPHNFFKDNNIDFVIERTTPSTLMYHMYAWLECGLIKKHYFNVMRHYILHLHMRRQSFLDVLKKQHNVKHLQVFVINSQPASLQSWVKGCNGIKDKESFEIAIKLNKTVDTMIVGEYLDKALREEGVVGWDRRRTDDMAHKLWQRITESEMQTSLDMMMWIPDVSAWNAQTYSNTHTLAEVKHDKMVPRVTRSACK